VITAIVPRKPAKTVLRRPALPSGPSAASGRQDLPQQARDSACRNRDELRRWAARLDELGIVHGGIKAAHYGSGVSFRDPDGIALEFFAPPS
jgi:hypothetical protein